jgi:hypothetical protein
MEENMRKRANQLEREKQSMEADIKELKKRNNQLKQEKQSMKENIKELKRCNDQLALEKQNLEKDAEKNIENLGQQLVNQKKVFEQQLQRVQEKLYERVTVLEKET